MIAPLEMAWLHAELDHDLDSTAHARLQAALDHSPELRAARAELLELDAALREAPPAAEPPRSLHARLVEMAAAASCHGVQEPDSTQPPTFRGARRIGWRAARIGWRMSRTHHRHESRGSTMTNMTTKKKALVTAVAVAIVAVAVGVAYMGDMFPHGANEMAAATIAPAHRYEASQVKSGDLQLGNQDAAKFVQTDAYQKIINDPAMLTLLRSDAFRNALANSELRSAMANSDALRSALQSIPASSKPTASPPTPTAAPTSESSSTS